MARRPGIGDFVSNWGRKDLRLDEKVSMTIRNNWKKLRTRSSCCGNHGEPGC